GQTHGVIDYVNRDGVLQRVVRVNRNRNGRYSTFRLETRLQTFRRVKNGSIFKYYALLDAGVINPYYYYLENRDSIPLGQDCVDHFLSDKGGHFVSELHETSKHSFSYIHSDQVRQNVDLPHEAQFRYDFVSDVLTSDIVLDRRPIKKDEVTVSVICITY